MKKTIRKSDILLGIWLVVSLIGGYFGGTWVTFKVDAIISCVLFFFIFAVAQGVFCAQKMAVWKKAVVALPVALFAVADLLLALGAFGVFHEGLAHTERLAAVFYAFPIGGMLLGVTVAWLIYGIVRAVQKSKVSSEQKLLERADAQ